MRTTTHWVMLLTAVVGALILTPGIPGDWQKPASAAPIVSGLEWVHASKTSLAVSPTTARAICPPNKVVLSGGGWVKQVTGTVQRKLVLTQLEPAEQITGHPDRQGFIATAASTRPPLLSERWTINAYALCANPLPAHHIQEETTDSSSAPRQETAAACPPPFRALGSGGRINIAGHEVALHMARASASGDIARAAGHEDANGYSANWSVTAFAVCASAPQGYEVVYAESERRASETEKSAIAECPDDKKLVGAGAAITNAAPGNVSLEIVFPSSHLDQASATAMENVPTDVNWDFIVAQASCTF